MAVRELTWVLEGAMHGLHMFLGELFTSEKGQSDFGGTPFF
jgi:hypothetical protein